ncbi:MAG: Rne/Rng family ribonuclease [Verrucomicrobia bacterium]|nr:Rne/Rng family ribonuclease [Verrucomicrobiota bacterium]
MAKEIIINVEPTEKRVAVMTNGVLEEYYFERSENLRITGNIYRARVVKVMPGIQAAFVNTGLRKNGFLHVSDITGEGAPIEALAGEELDEIKPAAPRRHKGHRLIEDLVKQDEDLLVQVVKESIGTKGPRLSTNISLPGRYLVLLPTTPRLGISRRVTDRAARDSLRQLAETLPVPSGMGLIMRTYAQERTKREVTRDLQALITLWEEIQARYKAAKKPTVLHNETELLTRVVRDALAEEVDRIVIDSRSDYRELRSFVSASGATGIKVELHTARTPIFEAYGIDAEIEKACRRRIWLKCGGSIVIERTEAMATIDVNTGRHVGQRPGPGQHADAEDTILTTNLEAAVEVARQLKLRNMGGLIVIDFIDMRSRTNQRKIYSTLLAALKDDKARTTVLPISKLGLVEMTRERDKESLGEEHFGECPYCRGTGRIKQVGTVSLEVQRALRKLVALGSAGEYKVCAHPDVIDRLRNEDAPGVDKLLKRSNLIVEFLPITDYHLEEWHCYPTQAGDLEEELQQMRPPRE